MSDDSNTKQQGSRAETPAPPVNSMGEASQAVATYAPEELYGLQPHKVKWNDLAGLAEELNAQVLSVLTEYSNASGGEDSNIGPALVGALGFCNKLLSLTYRITEAQFAERDFDWDQGARLLALALRVNFRDLEGVVSFFKAALPGMLSVSPSKTSTPATGPSSAAAA